LPSRAIAWRAPSPRSVNSASCRAPRSTWCSRAACSGAIRAAVGINFLEKIQVPTPATLYGALLAGVDYVLVGAGIPRDIPGLLDGLVSGSR